MAPDLTSGAIEAIVGGNTFDRPVLQIISSKKITAAGSSADRYRLLLSDGLHSYSHAMLATQLNNLMESGEMDNLAVVQVDKYLCNTIQGDRRVLILLDLNVIAKGSDVGVRLGNPQQFKPGEVRNENAAQPNGQPVAQVQSPVKKEQPSNTSNGPTSAYNSRPPQNTGSNFRQGNNPPASNYSIKAAPGTPGTPGSTRVHSIASLTPYQNRWRIRARVTQKSGIRTWSNSRGEGRLFSVNFLDESGEIRATGFNEAIDKYYDMLEVNKVYFVSRGTLKTANKQYSNVNNDYEMTFNNDTTVEVCTDDVDLPTVKFEFTKINELESKAPGNNIDLIGVVRSCGDVGTVIGKASQKEITKREVQLCDQSGMVVNLTLWGNEAQTFDGSGCPVLAVKGAKLSDYGGRSASVLASSQMLINPDIKEAHILRGWYDRDGQSSEFQTYRSEGGGAGGGGSSTNWKCFSEIKADNSIGQGDKADYFTSKGTVIFLRKENSMYKACPKEACNKKLIDQGNGMFRCEKCNHEVPNFKWRMILSANLADFSDNQWVTCFQESAELILGKPADELGDLKDTNEAAYDQAFQDAMFKSYIFRLRAKIETYNDESRLKTVCVNATPVDWAEQSRRLIEEIEKLQAS
ncbi:replication protein A 70 kDa DNA-binding subunit-like [Mytilus californianus]|uniref:replication protein A 70 kDa DNA-binding subunit-like n=1 Tax=Mytilus californianus TaxID=6549 RepID=UPI0022481F45|nr:replication protein A 70 kDa DNA-binding subunit-like [Mytilus californianus]